MTDKPETGMTAEAGPHPTTDDIEAWFKAHLAALIGMPAADVDGAMDFESFGIDSIQAVDMIAALQEWLGLADDAAFDFIFDAPSIRAAAEGVAVTLAETAEPRA